MESILVKTQNGRIRTSRLRASKSVGKLKSNDGKRESEGKHLVKVMKMMNLLQGRWMILIFCCSNAGQVRKSLTIKAHANGIGYRISLSKYS